MLRDDINNALKEAMKAKNERAVSTLRMVNSSLKHADEPCLCGSGRLFRDSPLDAAILDGVPAIAVS